MTRIPHRFIKLSAAEIAQDGQRFAVRVETQTAPPLDIEIPFCEVGAIVQYLVAVTGAAGAGAAKPPEMPVDPIPIAGIGFAAGRNPHETLLLVDTTGARISFALTSKQVAWLGRDFARIAQALAASDAQPH